MVFLRSLKIMYITWLSSDHSGVLTTFYLGESGEEGVGVEPASEPPYEAVSAGGEHQFFH